MTNTAKSVLWVLLGPLASLIAGYIAFVAFVFFAFFLGPSVDIDNTGTPPYKFFGAAAIPAFGIVTVGGTLFSWWVAFVTFRQSDRDNEPRDNEPHSK